MVTPATATAPARLARVLQLKKPSCCGSGPTVIVWSGPKVSPVERPNTSPTCETRYARRTTQDESGDRSHQVSRNRVMWWPRPSLTIDTADISAFRREHHAQADESPRK